MFHHGHSNCVCEGSTPLEKAKCAPGCISSMPSVNEPKDQYTWWDLYNISGFYHSLGYDVFVLSMPLKGINLGPGMPKPDSPLNTDHWPVMILHSTLQQRPGCLFPRLYCFAIL